MAGSRKNNKASKERKKGRKYHTTRNLIAELEIVMKCQEIYILYIYTIIYIYTMHVLLLYSITQLITRFPLLISSSSDCVLALHHRDRERESERKRQMQEKLEERDRRGGWQRELQQADERAFLN